MGRGRYNVIQTAKHPKRLSSPQPGQSSALNISNVVHQHQAVQHVESNFLFYNRPKNMINFYFIHLTLYFIPLLYSKWPQLGLIKGNMGKVEEFRVRDEQRHKTQKDCE